jgi:uncharacterized protein YndB with AHSA1/START domain
VPSETEPLRSVVRIAAPAQVVFSYFTDPARMVRWMGSAAVLDPRPGGTFRVEMEGRVVVGEYLELDPPRRIVFSWGYEGSELEAGSTRVEVTLGPDGDGTSLVLLHHGLPDALRDIHQRGWGHFLDRLATATSDNRG